MADFNEFNRELERRISDPQLRFVLVMMYQHIMAMAAQVDACANVVSAMVDTVGNVVELHSATQQKVQQFHKIIRGERMGGQFNSVPLTDDPEDM